MTWLGAAFSEQTLAGHPDRGIRREARSPPGDPSTTGPVSLLVRSPPPDDAKGFATRAFPYTLPGTFNHPTKRGSRT
jgi:hypothetical protein